MLTPDEILDEPCDGRHLNGRCENPTWTGTAWICEAVEAEMLIVVAELILRADDTYWGGGMSA